MCPRLVLTFLLYDGLNHIFLVRHLVLFGGGDGSRSCGDVIYFDLIEKREEEGKNERHLPLKCRRISITKV